MFHFEDIIDDGGGSMNPTSYGNFVEGKYGKGLTNKNSTYAIKQNSPMYNFLTKDVFSIDMWVNCNDSDSMITITLDDLDYIPIIDFGVSYGQIRCLFTRAGVSLGYNVDDSFYNKWNHIAIQCNGDGKSIYLNGTRVAVKNAYAYLNRAQRITFTMTSQNIIDELRITNMVLFEGDTVEIPPYPD